MGPKKLGDSLGNMVVLSIQSCVRFKESTGELHQHVKGAELGIILGFV